MDPLGIAVPTCSVEPRTVVLVGPLSIQKYQDRIRLCNSLSEKTVPFFLPHYRIHYGDRHFARDGERLRTDIALAHKYGISINRACPYCCLGFSLFRLRSEYHARTTIHSNNQAVTMRRKTIPVFRFE